MTPVAPTRRPQRIDQLIPAIIEHDAVSNHTFAAERLLHEMGFDSEIYASIIGPGTAGRVRPIDALRSDADGSQWVIYQASIGSPVADVFAAHPAPKLLDYHNITPAGLVERWIPPLGEESRLGRRQLPQLAPLVFSSFGDSAYNAEELRTFGFADPGVVTILVEGANLNLAPDPLLLERLARQRNGTTWLFVGQVAPHKRQHDIVSVLACYRRMYADDARLFIVGREMGHAYRDAVGRFVDVLGLESSVTFTGSVTTPELAAYYAAADVFVCLSEHEGFNAPIIEAMTRSIPVVAFAAAAVPGTVGNAGVLLEDKDPLVVAATVHTLMADNVARRRLIDLGCTQAEHFSLAHAEAEFRDVIDAALTLATKGPAPV